MREALFPCHKPKGFSGSDVNAVYIRWPTTAPSSGTRARSINHPTGAPRGTSERRVDDPASSGRSSRTAIRRDRRGALRPHIGIIRCGGRDPARTAVPSQRPRPFSRQPWRLLHALGRIKAMNAECDDCACLSGGRSDLSTNGWKQPASRATWRSIGSTVDAPRPEGSRCPEHRCDLRVSLPAGVVAARAFSARGLREGHLTVTARHALTLAEGYLAVGNPIAAQRTPVANRNCGREFDTAGVRGAATDKQSTQGIRRHPSRPPLLCHRCFEVEALQGS